MSKTLFESTKPKTQPFEAVKSLLAWRGRGTDPMPAMVEFTHEGGEGRLLLVLSGDKKNYHVTTARACSCAASTDHPGQPCEHQRKYFPQAQAQAQARTEDVADDEPQIPRGEFKPFGQLPGENAAEAA